MIVIPYKVFGYCHYYTIKAPRDFIQIKRAFKEICSIFSRGKQAYVSFCTISFRLFNKDVFPSVEEISSRTEAIIYHCPPNIYLPFYT